MDNKSIIKQYEVSGKICYECSLNGDYRKGNSEAKKLVKIFKFLETNPNLEKEIIDYLVKSDNIFLKCVNISYEYDALNHRLKRYDNEENTITKYAYGRSGAVIYQEETRQDNSVFARSYKYLNNEIVGWIDREGLEEKEYYTVNDHEGSVTEVYDNEGCLVWKNEYTAFGINAGESINLIDFNGMYTGSDFDVATGLTYHWNRWRNEDGNAFISEDPARDGYNWYGYAGQNPVMYTDPDGRETTDKNKAAIYPTVGNAFNLDFGRDYSNMAVQNFKNGHPILGTIQILDSACEIVYDLAAAYGCANVIGAFIAAPTALPEKSESWLQSNGKPNYPPNNGAVLGTEVNQTLEVGTKIGRYGEIGPNSSLLQIQFQLFQN